MRKLSSKEAELVYDSLVRTVGASRKADDVEEFMYNFSVSMKQFMFTLNCEDGQKRTVMPDNDSLVKVTGPDAELANATISRLFSKDLKV